MNSKDIDIRSKGTRNDYEVMERFTELLAEGFDGGRDEQEEAEFQAILKKIGFAAYAARELYHLRKRVKSMEPGWLWGGGYTESEAVRRIAAEVKRQMNSNTTSYTFDNNFSGYTGYPFDISLTWKDWAIVGAIGFFALFGIGSGAYSVSIVASYLLS